MLLFANGFIGALIFQILKGVGSGILFTTIGAMWPDVADYTEWKTGISSPGIVIATGLFCFKVFIALSSYLSGLVLSVSGYKSDLEVQSDFTLMAIRVSMVLITLICIIVAMIANARLHELTSEKNAQYHREIKNRG